MENQQQSQNESNEGGNGFNLKSFIPIALGLFFVLVLFFKFVLPALDKDVDHSFSTFFETGSEETYEPY